MGGTNVLFPSLEKPHGSQPANEMQCLEVREGGFFLFPPCPHTHTEISLNFEVGRIPRGVIPARKLGSPEQTVARDFASLWLPQCLSRHF